MWTGAWGGRKKTAAGKDVLSGTSATSEGAAQGSGQGQADSVVHTPVQASAKAPAQTTEAEQKQSSVLGKTATAARATNGSNGLQAQRLATPPAGTTSNVPVSNAGGAADGTGGRGTSATGEEEQLLPARQAARSSQAKPAMPTGPQVQKPAIFASKARTGETPVDTSALNQKIVQAVSFANQQTDSYRGEMTIMTPEMMVGQATGQAVQNAESYMNAIMQIALAAQAVVLKKAAEGPAQAAEEVPLLLEIQKMVQSAVTVYGDVSKGAGTSAKTIYADLSASGSSAPAS